jgi:hypothetical protein
MRLALTTGFLGLGLALFAKDKPIQLSGVTASFLPKRIGRRLQV